MSVSAQTHIYTCIDQLTQSINEWVPTIPGQLFHRFTATLPPISASQWLSAQHSFPQFFFKGRNDSDEFAALGSVWKETGIGSPSQEITQILTQTIPECRCYIALPFDGNHLANRMVFIPEFDLHTTPVQSEFSVTVKIQDNQIYDLSGLLTRLKTLGWELGERSLKTLRISKITHQPAFDAWKSIITDALSAIRDNQLQKVVLARQTHITLDQSITPSELLAALKSDNRYQIWFRENASNAFFCRSPERLFKLDHHTLLTEALASTLHDLLSTTADIHDQLLSDPKQKLEHELVIQDISERLSQICSFQSIQSNHHLYRVGQLAHLKSDFKVELNTNSTWTDALEALHPTAAIGGYPRQEALELITKLEPFSRGYYSGPMGWVNQHSAELAVGIRSGELSENRLTLYSGTGIVEGSVAEAEWAECNAKIQDVMALLQ